MIANLTPSLPPPRPGSGEPTPAQEAAVERMVRRFYERGLADTVLGPTFFEHIKEWEPHIALVRDFWLGAIHGGTRYRGNAFAPHMKVDFEPEAFAHWLECFERSAHECLAPEDAAVAVRVARHMATSFRSGLFPFTDANGRPARKPG